MDDFIDKKQLVTDNDLLLWIKKVSVYLEEPGDPVWENVRNKLKDEITLMELFVDEEFYKIESYNILKKTYQENPDLLTNPRKLARFKQLLETAFNV